jgi:hypothetical protein
MVHAESSTLPQAPIEATLTASDTSPFVRETFSLTLEIITRDVDIDPQLDLANLPAHDEMQITGPFEAMAVKRETRGNQEITKRRYRALAQANQAGTIELSPLLQLTSRKRVRSFFGSAMEVRPVTLQVPTTKLNIRPIPPSPTGFSGIIGDFDINMIATPTNIVAGDLVTIRTKLQGLGWVNEDLVPAVTNAPFLKTYRVKQVKPIPLTEKNQYVFTQTVIPLSQKLQAIPAVPFVWFDTSTETFRNTAFGPFPLSYVANTQEAKQVTIAETNTPTGTHPPPPVLRAGMQSTVEDTTAVRMAPALTSKSTFTIAPHSNIRILEKHDDWVLIDHANNRGWIPATAIAGAAQFIRQQEETEILH